MRRRTLLRTIAGVGAAGLAGCGGSSASGDTPTAAADEVIAGPDGSLTFAPETTTVATGTTVTWRFASGSHNVSCDPSHHDAASLPEEAEPFASYEGDDVYAPVPQGETFEHTFEVAGEYRYVCIPHATSRMIGTVEVTE